MRVVASLIALMTSATLLAAAPVEILANGSFEELRGEAPASWRPETWQGAAGWALDATEPHSGERCLKFSSESDQGEVVARQTAPLLQPGRPLTLTGWWRGSELTGTGARVVCRFLDSSGAKISDASLPNKPGSFAWEQFSANLEPPEGATSVQVFIELWKSAGAAWFDDVSVTQEVQPMDYDNVRIGGGAEEGDLRVAVIDGRPTKAKTYGPQGIRDALSQAEGIQAELLSSCTLYDLSSYDCVVVPEIQTEGGLGGGAQNDALAWLRDWRAALSAYVRAGGGIVLCHDSVGFRFALEHPLFPNVVRGSDRIEERQVARVAEHPVTEGVEPFECAFTDYISLEAGPDGEVIAFDAEDRPIVVAGEAGGGRVVGCGLGLGIDEHSKDWAPTGPEGLLLENAVRWAAGGTRQDVALVLTPTFVALREADKPLEFAAYAFAVKEEAAGTALDLEASLIFEEGEAEAQVAATVEVVRDGAAPASLSFDVGQLRDGVYHVAVSASRGGEPILPTDTVLATAELHVEFSRWAGTLPKSHFQWRSCNVHGPGGLKTADEIEQMVRHLKEMNFTALLIAGKPPNGRCYWDTDLGTRPEGFEGLDHLKVASEACEREGVQCLVQFCAFVEGSASDPSDFIKQHPELAEYHEGQPQELAERGGSAFGCPDQPEVRQYELDLIREIVTKYPGVDGISFDYIRYGNDRWCDCEHSKAMQAEFAGQHPDLSEREAKARFGEEQIVSFTWEVREVLDEVRPGLILHGYCHPVWANRFPMQYLSFRASAHGDQPGRGGMWTLERVFESAKRNVELADDHLDYMKASPMADTAYLGWEKTPERFRRELRLIYEAGARDLMVYPYSTLRGTPGLREMLAEEFAD